MTIHDLFVPFEDELQVRPSPRFPNPPLIEWCAAFGGFFFRPKGADPQLLWCDLGYIITPKRPLPPPRPTTLSKRVSRAFMGRSFFRVVPFPDGDDWLLIRPKRALIKSPHQPSAVWWQWNARFPTGDKTQLQWLSQDSAYFDNWLEEQKGQEDLSWVRTFARMTQEQRSWAPAVASPELLRQWHQLAQSLQLLVNSSNQSPQRGCIVAQQSERGSVYLSLEFESYGRSNVPECITHAALKLCDELTNRFSILIDLSRWRGLLPNGERQFHSFPNQQIDSVSMHQKMEAALVWRDFIKNTSNRPALEATLNELTS